MKNISVRNPLSIVAIFCSITEGLCIYALPKLTVENQDKFIWFIMVFPIILLGLFFFTLIKHHTKLYSPSDFDTKDNDFAGMFYNSTSLTSIENDTTKIDSQKRFIGLNIDSNHADGLISTKEQVEKIPTEEKP